MPINLKSLHARLLNLSRERKMDFQFLLNRLGAEQFLFRLSRSAHLQKFVFKGGSLLSYLIESDRKTRDLDFSIREMSHQAADVIKIIRSVLDIPVDDGIEWKEVRGEPLIYPDMDCPGIRVACPFLVGRMRGVVRIDMAMGDAVEGLMTAIQRMQYRNQPIFGESFSLPVYPAENIFAEKLCIALKKGGQNTRMKDYYDLLRLTDHKLNPEMLKKCIQSTFVNREMPLVTRIQFDQETLVRLQMYWDHFFKREKITAVPQQIVQVINRINDYLKKLYGS